MPTTTYIFHTTGTLEREHIFRALDSMDRQRFHWQRLVVHNAGGPLSTEEILALIDRTKFDEVHVLPHPSSAPPTVAYDWLHQMRVVDGTDRYLSHKADFILADGVCEALDSLPESDWYIPFHKFDMKNRCTDADFRLFAKTPWGEAIKFKTVGTYGAHLGLLAVPFRQGNSTPGLVGYDGTMHAYTDEIRYHYRPTDGEVATRWGPAFAIQDLVRRVPVILDDRFFALHQYHESPDRYDWNQSSDNEEKF